MVILSLVLVLILVVFFILIRSELNNFKVSMEKEMGDLNTKLSQEMIQNVSNKNSEVSTPRIVAGYAVKNQKGETFINLSAGQQTLILKKSVWDHFDKNKIVSKSSSGEKYNNEEMVEGLAPTIDKDTVFLVTNQFVGVYKESSQLVARIYSYNINTGALKELYRMQTGIEALNILGSDNGLLIVYKNVVDFSGPPCSYPLIDSPSTIFSFDPQNASLGLVGYKASSADVEATQKAVEECGKTI